MKGALNKAVNRTDQKGECLHSHGLYRVHRPCVHPGRMYFIFFEAFRPQSTEREKKNPARNNTAKTLYPFLTGLMSHRAIRRLQLTPRLRATRGTHAACASAPAHNRAPENHLIITVSDLLQRSYFSAWIRPPADQTSTHSCTSHSANRKDCRERPSR